MKAHHSLRVTVLLALACSVFVPNRGRSVVANERPVADAGPLRYAGPDPIRLDGSGSYDPDRSGPLRYTWRQLSGPLVTLSDTDTARVLISGRPVPVPEGRGQVVSNSSNLVQTEAVQECEFELVVSDGESTSLPATVKLIIVPFYGTNTLIQENPPFDPNKPTFIFFGGGDCVTGSGTWNAAAWASKANVLSYSPYSADATGSGRTYYRYGDMIIVYLSSVAPDYRQMIQTAGWSTGGQPAIDVGLRLNLTYRDTRYAVNRVSFLDATSYCQSYGAAITRFLASSVDGEQCWIDNYVGQNAGSFFAGVLNVGSAFSHAEVPAWFSASAATTAANSFNDGFVAGAYWSVIGPGKNLQLAPVTDQITYLYRWSGTAVAGSMGLFDESAYPGRLPEPVTLAAWVNRSPGTGAIDGAVLSCHFSENAVGYQLLLGSDPSRVMDFSVVSDTPAPPLEILREFPPDRPWWTVRIRDRHGSTIYADPVLLDLAQLPSLLIQNPRTGQRYGLFEHALADARPGDSLVLDPGTYAEEIEIGTTPVTIRSLDPNDPAVVAATILRGPQGAPVVTFAGGADAPCVLAGLTIRSQTVGISCRAAAPTIRNCVLQCSEGIALEFWHGCAPHLIDCTIAGTVREGGNPGLIAYWKLDETEGTLAHDSESDYDGTLVGAAAWQPAGGKMGGALQLDGSSSWVTTPFVHDPAAGPFAAVVWIKGGAPGQVIVSQAGGANWLMLGPNGALTTELTQAGRTGKPLTSSARLADDAWHRVGLVWDGSDRILFADGVEVARDRLTIVLPTSTAGLNLGAGAKPAPGTYWFGLLDDVRIYDQAVKP